MGGPMIQCAFWPRTSAYLGVPRRTPHDPLVPARTSAYLHVPHTTTPHAKHTPRHTTDTGSTQLQTYTPTHNQLAHYQHQCTASGLPPGDKLFVMVLVEVVVAVWDAVAHGCQQAQNYHDLQVECNVHIPPTPHAISAYPLLNGDAPPTTFRAPNGVATPSLSGNVEIWGL